MHEMRTSLKIENFNLFVRSTRTVGVGSNRQSVQNGGTAQGM